MTDATMTISNLRTVPQFVDRVAGRIWNAWWKAQGFSLMAVTDLVRESLAEPPSGIPTCLVAHRGAVFAGTVHLIVSDMTERPDYSPWLAALWVEEDERQSGVGGALVEALKERARLLGVTTLYLYAIPENVAFYQRRGWSVLEDDVGEEQVSILTITP